MKHSSKVFIWHSEKSSHICYACSCLDRKVFYCEGDIPKIPVHPNCRCWIQEIDKDDNDERKFNIIRQTIANEGGYIDNLHLIDQPTNAGITKATLDRYNKEHKVFNFPNDLKLLTIEQVEQIYKTYYYDERRIGDIKNIRIANAVFDMGVMSNFNNVIKMVQKAVNDTQNENLNIDGIMGNKTIDALNHISNIDDFMCELKSRRIKYLQNLCGFNKYGKGWTARTEKY